MVRQLPPQLYEVAQRQRGVLSRTQLLACGLTKDLIASQRSQGNWQRVYPGIYAIFSGDVSREATLWAAVLYAGRGAALSHQTAAELWGLADTPKFADSRDGSQRSASEQEAGTRPASVL